MRAELIQQLTKIVGKSSVVVDDTELLVYECDALTLFRNTMMREP